MTYLVQLSPFELLAITAILFAAGTTKGIIGIGLPIVAVPLLSMVVPLPTAVAAPAIPLLVTNLSQAATGDPIPVVLKGLWPILAGTFAGIVAGVYLLTGLSPDLLKPVVGVALIGVAALMLLAPKLVCPDHVAPFAGP